LLLPLVLLSPTLALTHTAGRATHGHWPSTATILIVLVLIPIPANAFFHFLLFEFYGPYFLFHFLDLVLQILLDLLCLFELLLNGQAVVGLQDLLVDKVAPRARVHLVVEVVLVKLVLRHLAVAECKRNRFLLGLHVLVDYGLQIARFALVVHLFTIAVEAHFASLRLKRDSVLSTLCQLFID